MRKMVILVALALACAAPAAHASTQSDCEMRAVTQAMQMKLRAAQEKPWAGLATEEIIRQFEFDQNTVIQREVWRQAGYPVQRWLGCR